MENHIKDMEHEMNTRHYSGLRALGLGTVGEIQVITSYYPMVSGIIYYDCATSMRVDGPNT